MDNPYKRIVSVLLPQALKDSVEQKAQELGVKRSVLLREAIICGLDKGVLTIQKQQKRMSK